MIVIDYQTGEPARCVRVRPVEASLRQRAYTKTPEVTVFTDRPAGLTWLAIEFGTVLLEVALEPGQVDTVTGGLLDELPVPYELPDPAPDALVCAAASPDGSDGICGVPVACEPCPVHSGAPVATLDTATAGGRPT